MASRRPKGPTPIEAVKHKDPRPNIPTEELRDFVKEDEASPKKIRFEGLLYARDPSLDPQLVWKGKDDQDRAALEVPAVPVYIQEKIHPQALVEDLRKESGKGEPRQASLFGDFNGLEFDKKVEFYKHGVHWANRMILGDSLLVMTSLAEKEGLKGKVQMIYIDPPYGINFGSNWQVSTRKRDVKDGRAEDATRQPEQIRAFRDTWKDGIHSYLSYLRDRLVVARELLTESGSVFVQIGDENVHLVRSVMDEVFGSENQIATISFQKTGSTDQSLVPQTVDYLLFYAKNFETVKYQRLYQERTRGALALERYDLALETNGALRRLTDEEIGSGKVEGDGVRAQLTSLTSARPLGAGDMREAHFEGVRYVPGAGTFKTDHNGMGRLAFAGRIKPAGSTLRYLRRVDDFPVVPINDRWESVQLGTGLMYVVQTSTTVLERCLLMTTDPGDLVLDPTCGSGTTAFVAEQWGRRWITIDTSRVALALARTRLMAAKYDYYLLQDTPEGGQKEAEITGLPAPSPPPTGGDIKKGFVCKRVPHVTLKSIANNEEIDVIHGKFESRLGPIRADLNKLLKESWEEWQVPREPGERWPERAKGLLKDWWSLRRERQKEIDDSIARHADVEILHDQPYEDGKRIRVSGPFTVESLSPHRVLAAEDERPASESQARTGDGAQQFETMILENLRKAGVQNMRKAERITFESLDPFPGRWIHAQGTYAAPGGVARRVALSLGPEHGTVGAEQVKEAAKEALQGRGFDLLIVMGFAFDAHADETAKEFTPEPAKKQTTAAFAVAEGEKAYGKLPVLLARMNPDLQMGDELLKKTGAGNLFMVFGEPDVAIRKEKGGKLVAQIKGLDVYDPTTGQIRTSAVDDIAAWFLDTEYDGESFFVRHAYFTGAGDPYERLKRALKAEIDESAWASLYRTASRPFDPPKTGKIAVKVINHYGDEVLKVYST